MIPQEVADIADILRSEIEFEESDEAFVISLAYKIYNKVKKSDSADYESRPMFHS